MGLNDTQTHKKCFGETVLTLMTVVGCVEA